MARNGCVGFKSCWCPLCGLQVVLLSSLVSLACFSALGFSGTHVAGENNKKSSEV